MSGQMLLINPRKRRAATRRAAPRKRKTHTAASRRRRAAPVVVMANPSPRRRRSRLSALRTRARHIGRKYRRNPTHRLSFSSITSMAKSAAIGAAGALAVDVGFGYLKGMLPANMQTPVDASGAMNPLYFAAKAALAIGVGVLGKKVTKHAGEMAAGSLTVQTYEIMRSFVPTPISLGNVPSAGRPVGVPRVSPSGRVIGMSQYVSGYTAPSNEAYMGQYVSGNGA